MELPFLKLSGNAASERWDATTITIVGLHVAALVLFLVNPLAGAIAFGIAATIAVGLARPIIVLVLSMALLWVNVPIGDFLPFSQVTAWKDLLLVPVILGWLIRSIVLRRPLVLDHPLSRPLLSVVAFFIVSCALSPSLTHALLGLKACIFYSAWYFILPDIVKSKRDVRALVAAVLFCTVCLSIYNLWAVQQPFGTFPIGRLGRALPGALAVHWSPASALLPPGILFGMVIAPRLSLWRRLAVDATVVIGVAGLLATTGRASWGFTLLATAVMALVSRRLGFARIGIVALIAAAVIQATLALQLADRASSAFESNDVSAEAREAEFSTMTLPFVLTHPLGAGTGSMSAKASAQVWGGGSDVDLVLQHGVIHNGFLQVAIETGWLGLAAYIWMLVTAMLESLRMFRKARDPLIRDVALSSLGIVLFFAGMNLGAHMLTVALISFDIWIFLGLITLLPHLDDVSIAQTASLDDPVAG